MVGATGAGPWPGKNIDEALRVIRGELADPSVEGVRLLPYFPELPERGPGSDLIGRAAGALVDLPVDLQPHGWRLVDRPGRDAARTASLWRQDHDVLAEVFHAWQGGLKVQLCGPWTLASQLWMPRGDRVVSDLGALRDMSESLREGIRAQLATLAVLLPGCPIHLQLDEPGLPAVLAGTLRSDSGIRALRVPEHNAVVALLHDVVTAARSGGAATVAISCQNAQPPIDVIRQASADAVAVDAESLTEQGWFSIAEFVEGGGQFWAGLPVDQLADAATSTSAIITSIVRRWREIGLEPSRLAQLTLRPSGGLAGHTPEEARNLTQRTVQTAAALADAAAEGW